MSDTKNIPDGSVQLKPEVVTRCAFCGKANPQIEVREAGRSDNQILAAMVMCCCKRILNCQILDKVPDAPLIN
jgi:hypothetical protein